MKLALGGIERDGFVKLVVDGTVTSADFSPDGKNPLEGVLGPTWNTFRVVMDMAQVVYADSSAIGWLISSQKSFKDAGGAIAVYHLQPAVKQVFDLLKVGKVVPLCENELAARAAIGASK